MPPQLRNICIIAHVDHGKTTLVDYMLRQAGTFQLHERLQERVMDSLDLERERGITILAKNASIRLGDTKINLVDTPGHADFGGEVERIMAMIDGALLLVDAAEGPLPQTRFVLQKALASGLKIILVINKVDRPECADNNRIHEVINQTLDLFVDLGASDEQLDFPIVFACARLGWCTTNYDELGDLLQGRKTGTLTPLFDLILNEIPPPQVAETSDFQMIVSNLAYSNYVGRLAVGRVISGRIMRNQKLIRHGIDRNKAPKQEPFLVTRLYNFEGLEQVETDEVTAGDIGLIAGSELVEIGDTLVNSIDVAALPRLHVEPPTLSVLFSVNTSPFSGQEGEATQSRKLRERLVREVRNNVALRFEETNSPDQFRMLGRGELQFAILVEQMRREGSEFMIGKPLVLYQTDEAGDRLEPIECAVLDFPEGCTGEVSQIFQQRKGMITRHERYATATHGRVRLEVEIPTRGLLGIRSRYLNVTRGEGLFSSRLLGHAKHRGPLPHRQNGALVSDRTGQSVEYALFYLEERGMLFLGPGIRVYEGMIVGEHNRENDLNVNPCKEKKLTNLRSAHAEILVTLKGYQEMPLEKCLEWIDEDEWIEVTPKTVRLRKKVLDHKLRSLRRSERIE